MSLTLQDRWLSETVTTFHMAANNTLSLAKEQWKGVRQGFSDLVWSNFLVTWRIIFLRHHTQATINNYFNTFSSFHFLSTHAKIICLNVYKQGRKSSWISIIVQKSEEQILMYVALRRFFSFLELFCCCLTSENWVVTFDVHSRGGSQRSNNKFLYEKLSWHYWIQYIRGIGESFG